MKKKLRFASILFAALLLLLCAVVCYFIFCIDYRIGT